MLKPGVPYRYLKSSCCLPPLHLSPSMTLSPCCLHIKLHLTSISVKESGASGCCPTAAQRFLPFSPSFPLFLSYHPSFTPQRALLQMSHSLTKRLISTESSHTVFHESTCGFTNPLHSTCCSFRMVRNHSFTVQ